MEQLSEEQIEEFKEAFSLFDVRNEGTIETKELGQVLRCLGILSTEEEKKYYIDKYDANATGVIYFNDFLEIVILKISESTPEEEIREALKIFDFSKQGLIEIDILKEEFFKNCSISSNEMTEICDYLNKGEEPHDLINTDNAVQIIMNKVNPHMK